MVHEFFDKKLRNSKELKFMQGLKIIFGHQI